MTGVEDIAIVSATVAGANALDAGQGEIGVAGKSSQLGTLNLVDPALATELALTVRFLRKQPDNSDTVIPDQAALQGALQNAITYLNTRNQSDSADLATDQMRRLSFGKLAVVLPLPGKSTQTLQAYDRSVEEGSASGLPTVGSLSPYSVQLLLTRPNGVSQVLDVDAATFTLEPFERLTLGPVVAQVKPKE